MTPTLHIGQRAIGSGRPVYVIAEIGSNHNGSLDTAKELIETCASAGVDAVKFQAFTRENLFINALPEDGGNAVRQRDQQLLQRRWHVLPQFTASSSWWPELAQAAEAAEVAFTCTPFGLDEIDIIADLDPPLIKIASGDITWHELIAAAAGTGLPLVLSTGASDLDEVAKAVTAAREGGAEQLALLHCVSSYPPAWHEAQLHAIGTLRDHFEVPVGLSDHSPGSTLPVAATALGACIIEKHVTLDRHQEGLDHHFALEPDELAQLVTDVKHTTEALGDSRKTWAPGEHQERFWVRRGLWMARSVTAGTKLQREDIACLRPAMGLGVDKLDAVIGQPIVRDLVQGDPLRDAEVAWPGTDHGPQVRVQEVIDPTLAAHCARFFARMLEDVFSQTFSKDAIAAYRERHDVALFRRRALDQLAVVVCARMDNEVVGLVLGGSSNGGVASLDWVVVAPEHQGHSIGRRMLQEATDAYRRKGAHKLVLYTETAEAREFYLRLGWQEEGHHPRHWWRKDHTCLALPLAAGASQVEIS